MGKYKVTIKTFSINIQSKFDSLNMLNYVCLNNVQFTILDHIYVIIVYIKTNLLSPACPTHPPPTYDYIIISYLSFLYYQRTLWYDRMDWWEYNNEQKWPDRIIPFKKGNVYYFPLQWTSVMTFHQMKLFSNKVPYLSLFEQNLN